MQLRDPELAISYYYIITATGLSGDIGGGHIGRLGLSWATMALWQKANCISKHTASSQQTTVLVQEPGFKTNSKLHQDDVARHQKLIHHAKKTAPREKLHRGDINDDGGPTRVCYQGQHSV